MVPKKRLRPLKPERDAYQVALDLLARREHSRVELTHKLRKKGFANEQIDCALQQLNDRGLQSDQRFVEDYVRSRILKGNGPLRISQELRQRGIEDGEAQIGEQDIDWLEVASSIYAKKFHSSEIADARERAKRQRYLQSKGFSNDIIRQIIR